MTRYFAMSFLLILIIAILVACAPGSANLQRTDPFPAEAYTPLTAGILLSADTFDTAMSTHEAYGTVYQVVYDQVPGFGMSQRHIYRYDDFPVSLNAHHEAESVWFRGQTQFFLVDDVGTDLPVNSESAMISITNPGLYALAETSIFSLPFVSISEPVESHCHTVTFITIDLNDIKNAYTIYRDGTVIRNDSEVAQELLPEDVTALLFAVKYAYRHASQDYHTYADAATDFVEFGMGVIRVTVQQGGQEWTLTEDESQTFLGLLSDQPGGEDDFADYSFRSFLRCNGTVEDLGEPVLEFTLVRTMPDGVTKPGRTYTLCDSGKVAHKLPYGLEEYRGSDIPTLDQLLINRWFISRSNFDVQAVLASLPPTDLGN